MFHQARVLCLLACVAGWSTPGLAQPVYRCGDSYTNQPCPGGRQIQADDPRTPAQRAQTTEAAKRDAKLADEMEKTRLKQEAKAAVAPVPPAPAVAEPPAESASDRTYSPMRAKKPAYFTAVSPKKPGAAKAAKVAKKKPISKKAKKAAS
jgi:hypothetical protein